MSHFFDGILLPIVTVQILGIIHGFSCINICRLLRSLFEHKADKPSAQTSPEGEDFQFSGPQKVTEKPFTCNTPQHHQISIAYLLGL